MEQKVVPNKRKVRLSSGVFLTLPESYDFSKGDEPMILEAVSLIELATSRKVHSVHLNQDNENPERLYGMNFVFDRIQEE